MRACTGLEIRPAWSLYGQDGGAMAECQGFSLGQSSSGGTANRMGGLVVSATLPPPIFVNRSLRKHCLSYSEVLGLLRECTRQGGIS